MQKIKTFFTDHYHLLFKSAATNHLRIQELLKNTDGTYQLTLKFDSYSELKKYQKKLRRLTVSLSSAVAMVVVALIVSPYIINPNKSNAASFLWSQASWGGTVNAGGATKNGWTDYASKDTNITAEAGGVSLTLPSSQDMKEDLDADFSGMKTGDGFYTNGSGQLLLKKPIGAACAGVGECASGSCTANICN